MGALKILKRLEKEGVLISNKVMQARIYGISKSEYAKQYVSFLLSRERKVSQSSIKVWVNELSKIKNADLAILFGSALRNKNPNDIDVLLVSDEKKFKALEKEIADLNKVGVKKIHPLFQSFEDVIDNIKKGDKPLLNAIKGVVVFGENVLMEVYYESCK
jgi:predicted nucleotidyltransferase